ncbi:hypothetical protein M139_4678 [Bacteroides fragilis str. S23L24]|nr:hypothetical protein M139_4678 [Bacteroides fragilis str. S23L24]
MHDSKSNIMVKMAKGKILFTLVILKLFGEIFQLWPRPTETM